MTYKLIRYQNGWCNSSEALAYLGTTPHIFRQVSTMFPADQTVGKRPAWSRAVLDQMKPVIETWTGPVLKSQRNIRRANGWLNWREAAEYLKINETSLRRTYSKKYPPDQKVGNHPAYSKKLLDKIKSEIGRYDGKDHRYQRREAEGFVTIGRAAELHGVPRVTWTTNLKRGDVPKPTHDRGLVGIRFYTLSEAEAIARTILGRRNPEGMYRTIQLAEMFGVSVDKIMRWSKKHGIGKKIHSTRRAYSRADVKKLAKLLGVKCPKLS